MTLQDKPTTDLNADRGWLVSEFGWRERARIGGGFGVKAEAELVECQGI